MATSYRILEWFGLEESLKTTSLTTFPIPTSIRKSLYLMLYEQMLLSFEFFYLKS